jgi:monofunctional chorismate mutase
MDRATKCRGIRGAITVDDETPEAVGEAALTLLNELVTANDCPREDVAAVIFTIPQDLEGSNPSAAARQGGWDTVPFLMVKEHGGDTSVPRCLRALLLCNTIASQSDIRHLYLRGAAVLRPDLDPGPVI